jgi:hypothetical protein
LPFLFPGHVPGYEDVYPDVTRINPAYFKYLDRKIDYLEAHGFTVFLEALRRDLSQSWRRYYPWPDSYTRYLLYLYTRYGASNVILSPIHQDVNPPEMPATAFLPAIHALYDKYGPPPFGNLSSIDAGHVEATGDGLKIPDAAPDRQLAPGALQLLVSDRGVLRPTGAAGFRG